MLLRKHMDAARSCVILALGLLLSSLSTPPIFAQAAPTPAQAAPAPITPAAPVVQTPTPKPAATPPQSTAQLLSKAPFKLYSNLVIVNLGVNGGRPRPFAIDSALRGSILDAKVAGLLPKSALAKGMLTYDWPDYKFKAQGAQVASLASLAPILGRNLAGIVGTSLFAKHAVTIDYQQKRITISDLNDAPYDGDGQALPLSIVNGAPLVAVQLVQPGKAPVTARLKIDTGSEDTAQVSGALLTASKLIPLDAAEIEEQSLDRNGKTSRFIARIQSIRIGKYKIDNPYISHSITASSSPGVGDGTLGGEILRRFTLTLDFPHKRVIFEPNDSLSNPFKYDASGLFITAGGPALNKFVVYSARKGSPGAHVGIAAGDIVSAIDGAPTSKMTLDQVRQTLTQAGKTVTISVQRGPKTIPYVVKLYTLI